MNIFKRLFGNRSKPEPGEFSLAFQIRSALPIRAIQVVTLDAPKRPAQQQLTGFTDTATTNERED
jgi:hypothetical protein